MTQSYRSAMALMFACALLLGGCNVAAIGNVMVLFVSVGIFFGTLNLGRLRTNGATSSTAETSQRDR